MSDQRLRSPKFPSMALDEAILEIAKVYEAEDRNRMSREVLAAHLGYSGISGASAAKIGALRHFALVEGSGDELRVSPLAITLVLKDPSDIEYKNALRSALTNPSLYSDLLEEYDTKPSLANLEYSLIKRGFLKKSAAGAAQDFLKSAEFANWWNRDEDGNDTEEHPEVHDQSVSAQDTRIDASPPTKLEDGEEEISSGRLSKSTKYRLLVTGKFGAEELDLLVKKLELDRAFLD